MSGPTIASIITGAILTTIYVIYAYKERGSAQLVNAVIVFAACGGFIAGARVVYFALVNKELHTLAETAGIDVSLILVGGFAICWVSVLSAIQAFRFDGLRAYPHQGPEVQ